MRTNMLPAMLALALISALSPQLSTAHAQGSLTPPGAPAPTMRTLMQIEPRTPISSLPLTITNPGSYYLTTNLTGGASGANGITVNCGNVTIDLNGFALLGVPGSGTGIAVTTTYTNLVFRNGSVTGWGGNGIDAYTVGLPRNILIEKIVVSGNGANGIHSEAGSIVRDCLAFGNSLYGFNSAGGVISDCVARNNYSGGFAMYNGSLFNCKAEVNNSGYGIYLSAGRALDCDCFYNGTGVDCQGTGDELRRCRIASNSGAGVFMDTANSGDVVENCLIENNTGDGITDASGAIGGSTIRNNTFNLNTGGGAIVIGENNDYVENNYIVTTSGNYGIAITSSGYTNIVVVKNVVVGGGASYNYSNIGGVNDFGPIGSASSATSPWANISH